MIYQNPNLLYALFAIAIPIFIHLFNFRKHKKIYFSSIRFLKDIKEKNRKKSELKNILILVSRILGISFLVVAFAKPYKPVDTTKISNDIFLYIDNSKSMDIDFGQGNLLNRAKNKAITISETYPSDNNFYLITNDFEAKHTLSYTANLIKMQIEKIQSSTKQRSITDIISRMNGITSKNSHLYFISDCQKETLKISDLKEDRVNNTISLVIIPNNNVSNISIDSLFISSPILKSENEVKIHVIISNESDEEIKDEVIFLYLNEKQKSQQYISLLAKEKKEIIFKFITKNNTSFIGEIRTHDSPVTFDNNLFFTLTKSEKINVTTINNMNENISFNALFGQDTTLFNFTSLKTENINYNNLSKQNFIILNEVTEISSGLLNTLISFTNNGGSLLVVPPTNLEKIDSYNILLSSLGLNSINIIKENKLKINQFNTKHAVYKNVFTKDINKINYPISTQAYYLNKQKMSTQIIGFANKQDFLTSYISGKGIKYQFASPLNKKYNNFITHALFVPTLINMAASSTLINTPYYVIGSSQEINTKHINTSNSSTHIKGKNIDIIPTLIYKDGRQLLNHHNQITKNGIYSILNNNTVVDKIAFNYNTSESIIASFSNKELKDYIVKNNMENINVISTTSTAIKKLIVDQRIGKEYWKISLILSLLFFALEILFIKLIKI